MALLKEVQAKIPSADAVVGRVIAHHRGKHIDIGEYVGEGVVRLNPAGEAVMAELTEESAEAPRAAAPRAARAPARKGGLDPSINADLG